MRPYTAPHVSRPAPLVRPARAQPRLAQLWRCRRLCVLPRGFLSRAPPDSHPTGGQGGLGGAQRALPGVRREGPARGGGEARRAPGGRRRAVGGRLPRGVRRRGRPGGLLRRRIRRIRRRVRRRGRVRRRRRRVRAAGGGGARRDCEARRRGATVAGARAGGAVGEAGGGAAVWGAAARGLRGRPRRVEARVRGPHGGGGDRAPGPAGRVGQPQGLRRAAPARTRSRPPAPACAPWHA